MGLCGRNGLGLVVGEGLGQEFIGSYQCLQQERSNCFKQELVRKLSLHRVRQIEKLEQPDGGAIEQL